jgi:hypothetical protein
MVRIAAILLVIGGTLAAGPAVAQFGNIFGNPSPPRPPADVPNRGFPAQPPPVGYPGQQQAAPGQNAPPPSAIQAQPLPPPPGAAAAPPPASSTATPAIPPSPLPAQRARPAPQPVNTPPAAQPANPGAPQQANAPPAPTDNTIAPDDTVVTETPTQKIVNGRAVFSGLDKITGRIISFDSAINETVQFGALQVTAKACYTRPPTEPTNTDAFVDVDEVTLKGEIKRIFTGWMFASSPGLHAVEHPIYDVWLTDCSQPEGGAPAVAQSTAPPAAAAAPGQQRQPRQVQPAAPRRPVAPAVAPQTPPVTND